MTEKSEMYKMGWDDYMNVYGKCNFQTDLEYMKGWDDAKEAVSIIENDLDNDFE